MKIDIIGSVGSGKTSLAKELSVFYRIPYYEKDEIVWARSISGDYKRSDKERDYLFAEILKQDDWIAEGSPRRVLRESFAQADLILFLDTPSRIRLYRLVKRWVRQRLGRESYSLKPDFSALRQYLKWHRDFNRYRHQLLQELSIYEDKICLVKSAKEAKNEFIAKFQV
ncbi:DNA topology modulation protein FlaR [Streptococcus caprae]|uniref:DNA topology modulation protein FlaR n=1 Tax=Streptococcus caprae TaxID=1640501 RepID=A0ABV8CTN5_9STRE